MAFRHITFFGEVGPLEQIEQNIIWYLKDSLLNIGAYYNIATGTTGYDGNDLSLLRPSYQPEHSNFQFWQGLSNHWIWESGLVPTYAGGVDPLIPSGIFMSGTFYPSATTTGALAHYIDYARGGVVFDTARGSGNQISCERSERAVFVYPADSDEYRKLTYSHLRSNDVVTNVPGSGLDNYSPELRAYMPAIFVQVNLQKTTPYELGALNAFKDYKVEFQILAESKADVYKLRDICYGLEGLSINMFDVNAVVASGDFPLDYKGRITDDAKIKSILVSDYFWKEGRFNEDAVDTKLAKFLPAHRGRVSLGFQVCL